MSDTNYDSAGIKSSVLNFVIDSSFGDKEKINETTFLFREGYFDSMGFVSLIAFLEEKFSIQTADTDLVEENFETVNAITDFVQKKLTINSN